MNLHESIELMKTAELMTEGMSDNLLRDFKYSLENKYDVHSDEKTEHWFNKIDYVWNNSKKDIKSFPNLWKYFVADHIKGQVIKRLIKIDNRFEPLKKKSKKIFFDTSVKNTISEFKHYMTVEDERIRKFNPNQFDNPFEKMNEIEQEIIENMSDEEQIVDMDFDDVTVLIDFKDGFFWVDLNKSSCELEGDAMGHCGNTAEERESQTVISLRKKIENGKYKPFLTFILDKDNGYLGETKGRANQKPAQRYHKYIVELLKLPMIKGFEAGGYAEDDNFHFDDLSQEEQDMVLQHKGDNNDFGERKLVPRLESIFPESSSDIYGVSIPLYDIMTFDFDSIMDDDEELSSLVDIDDDLILSLEEIHDEGALAQYIVSLDTSDSLNVDEVTEALNDDIGILSSSYSFDNVIGVDGLHERMMDSFRYRYVLMSDFYEVIHYKLSNEIASQLSIPSSDVSIYTASNSHETTSINVTKYVNTDDMLKKMIDLRWIDYDNSDVYVDKEYISKQIMQNIDIDELHIIGDLVQEIKELSE